MRFLPPGKFNAIRPVLTKIIFVFLSFSCIPSNASGLSYEHLSNGYFTSIHVLIVDPTEYAILPVKADSRETVAALANRHGAIAAVNGGFWKLNGNPAGILKINHRWYGTPIKPRGAIGWSSNGQRVLIDKVLTNYRLDDCEANEIEVIPMSTPPYTTREDWKKLEHIVGGTPVLISNRDLVEDYSSEQTLDSFLINKHPRTAVGIRENGEWVFVVVDGRFHGFFGGMAIKELAELMLMLGCTDALNLDGGGSSTIVLERTVINEPCGKMLEDGKQVEAVSDAILILHANSI